MNVTGQKVYEAGAGYHQLRRQCSRSKEQYCGGRKGAFGNRRRLQSSAGLYQSNDPAYSRRAEYDKLKAAAEVFSDRFEKLTVGQPLLAGSSDILRFAEKIAETHPRQIEDNCI